MMRETGCDFVMIARGARGNPWIVRGDGYRPSVREIYAMILRHTGMQLEEKGEYLGVCQMRKHISWYTTGLPGSAELRARVNRAGSYDEIKAVLDAWLRDRSLPDSLSRDPETAEWGIE